MYAPSARISFSDVTTSVEWFLRSSIFTSFFHRISIRPPSLLVCSLTNTLELGGLFHPYFEIFHCLCDACRPCHDSSKFTVSAPINAKVNGVNCYLPRAAKIDIVT